MNVQTNVIDILFNFEKKGYSEDSLLDTAKDFLEMLVSICNVELPTAEELVADYISRV